MGWKNLKEHYRIEHYVQVTEKGICIGSPYIHDLIIVGLDGKILKSKEDFSRTNSGLARYLHDIRADGPDKVRELIQSADTFKTSIPVYTYKGSEIVEKMCEELEWPHVTHDGEMMYENVFSADKNKVVKWAKDNAREGIRWRQEQIEKNRQDCLNIEIALKEQQSNLAKLDADYPA